MGDGNSDVGTKTAKLKRPRISGAMQQQCGDSSRGNQSALQKFVQLVGHRDPNARPGPWVQPRPVPVKR